MRKILYQLEFLYIALRSVSPYSRAVEQFTKNESVHQQYQRLSVQKVFHPANLY